MNDSAGIALDELARETLAAAPRPVPFAAVRILAERRRAELSSRRLQLLVTLASALPLAVLLGACGLRAPVALSALSVTALMALALAAASAAMTAAGASGPGSGPSRAAMGVPARPR